METRRRLEILLLDADPASAVRDALTDGWLDRDIPELMMELDFLQRTRYHHLSNLDHSLGVMAGMPACIDERLAGLLHDIGKRRTTTIKPGNGEEQYLGHAPVGARQARVILERLGYEPALVDRVCRWIAHHMDLHSAAANGHSDKAQAKLLSKIEPDLEILQRLQLADIRAMNPNISKEKEIEALDYHRRLAETRAGRTN